MSENVKYLISNGRESSILRKRKKKKLIKSPRTPNPAHSCCYFWLFRIRDGKWEDGGEEEGKEKGSKGVSKGIGDVVEGRSHFCIHRGWSFVWAPCNDQYGIINFMALTFKKDSKKKNLFKCTQIYFKKRSLIFSCYLISVTTLLVN